MTKGGTYASPPCMAAEVVPAYFGPLGVDRDQTRDVARWRRAERARLAIGVALGAARLPTFFPQPHDIPLDLILTEDGVAAARPEARTDR